MPPSYSPRNFEFGNIIQGMKGLMGDKPEIDLNDAILEARRMQASDLTLKDMQHKEQDYQDQEAMQEQLKAIDPSGTMNSDDIINQALKIAAKSGDLKSTMGLAESQRRTDQADSLDEYRRQRFKQPVIRTGPNGSVVSVDPETGQAQILLPGQQKEQKIKKVWITKGGHDLLVPEDDANDYTGEGWHKKETFADKLAGLEDLSPDKPKTDSYRVGQKAIVNGRKAIWNGSGWDYKN